MQINVSAPTVIRSQVENHLDVLHHSAGNAGLAEVRFDKADLSAFDVPFDIFEPATGKIVDDANCSTTIQQRVHQIGADERCAACDQNLLTIPHHELPLNRAEFAACSITSTNFASWFSLTYSSDAL